MKKAILIFILFPFELLHPQSNSAPILSEIMFYSQSSGNEFIEIYNLSETENIDLTGFKIIYQDSKADTLKSNGAGMILKAKSFAVIFEGDYDFTNGIYKNLIPANTLILKINDNSFGSRGMSNSADRSIRLLNSTDDTIQTYIYSANNSEGFSDEKILLNGNNSITNWDNSIQLNGTPGFNNSVSPLRYDLKIESFSFSPEIPIEDSSVSLSVKIKNNGSSKAENYQINIYKDLDLDSAGNSSELIFSKDFLNLNSNDSSEVQFILNSLSAGTYNFISEIKFIDDENISNNIKYLQIIVFPPANNFNDIVINEIMYAPKNGEPEWIEFYNKSSEKINLNNWSISDEINEASITNSDFFLDRDSFLVISKDSAIFNFYSIPGKILFANFPSLNNSGDKITIKDSLGIIIDSLNYLPEWGGNNGKSLERISLDNPSNQKENWGSSKDKNNATPGKINSIIPLNFDLKIESFSFFPEIPIEDSSISLKLKIKNIGVSNAENFQINIYKDLDLDSAGNSSELIFSKDFLNLNTNDSSEVQFILNSLSAGTYNFISEIKFIDDENIFNNIKFLQIIVFPPANNFNDIVINEIMYAPKNGEPEWLEIFNKSSEKINLNGWTISDQTSQTILTSLDFFLDPNSFLVISKDSAIFNFYSIPGKILFANFPSLNNSGDKITIKDSLGIIIDSLNYLPEWGGNNGKSLERISLDNPSNQKENWGSSKDKNNATPGKINSVTKKDFDIILSEIIFAPEFPLIGENVSISIKLKNNGKNSADFSISFFEDVNLDSIPDNLLLNSEIINILPNDSSIIPLSYQINNLQKEKGFYAIAEFDKDQDTSNNYFYKKINPGFRASAILINEIMYDPLRNEPEWIELINNSDENVNLKDWKISGTLPDTSKNLISEKDFFIEPDEFFIITKDSSFFNFYPGVDSKVLIADFGTLGNASDGIIIYDFTNSIIDSVKYNSNWGGQNGFSLERISLSKPTSDSTNWLSSIDTAKSTPGKKNSIINISSYKKNDIVINEIMFDPDQDNSEFIEFLNISTEPINIAGWKIQDENGNSYFLSKTNFIVKQNSFFILSADSLIFSKYDLKDSSVNIPGENLALSNSGELILLKDFLGNTIDSVFYSDKWHNKNFIETKNISLERINPYLNSNDPQNWSSSASSAGATPGKQNSIYTLNKNLSESISVSPNPFSPDNDGFEDFAIINFKLSQPTSQIRIKIFDSKGRFLRTLSNNRASGSQGSIIFNGLDDSGNPLRMGIYIIFLEALNSNSGVVETLKKTVVIARKL